MTREEKIANIRKIFKNHAKVLDDSILVAFDEDSCFEALVDAIGIDEDKVFRLVGGGIGVGVASLTEAIVKSDIIKIKEPT